MLHRRPLERHEIERIWSIDRSEVHHHVYRFEGGDLVCIPDYFDLRGWPPEQVAQDTPVLYACFDRGGAFIGMFDDRHLVGVAVLDTIPLGPAGDQLQLKYLYVSRSYRRQGIGHALLREAQAIARTRGAKALYISSTPTENTVNFYRRWGAIVATPPDPGLYAHEPDDIHFLCPV
jgi:GNAT superfamily N-acetyltransferase